MEFSVNNRIQHICYERMKLLDIRTTVNKSINFRQLNPEIVKTIWQLKIQKKGRKEVEEERLQLLGMHQALDMLIFQTLDKLLL